VVRYVRPEEFDRLGELARRMGFEQVASGPFVRSSYHAREMLPATDRCPPPHRAGLLHPDGNAR